MLIQFLFVLVAIIVGARLGGIGLGVMGGIGLAVLTFVFGLQPTMPPIDVMLMIAAVISAASCMQAAGGLDYMVKIAERILRRNPAHITILAPLVTYTFTFIAGTGHIAYSLLPVIAEVATDVGEGSIIAAIVSEITTPFTSIICTAVAFIALFFVAKLVLTLLFALIDKIVDNGIVGVANRVIGAVFMGALAFIVCWGAASIFELVINLPVFEGQTWVNEFTGGFIYKLLKSINPIDILLSF